MKLTKLKLVCLSAFFLFMFQESHSQSEAEFYAYAGENTETPLSLSKANKDDSYSFAANEMKVFKEYSIGFLLMTTPLNIKNIQITSGGQSSDYSGTTDLFSMGYGVALNADFNDSGFGFGGIMYYALISGKEKIRGHDFFVAFKYDFPLGNRLTTDFEISPLLGVGVIALQETDDDKYYGSSSYISGGARLTWRATNWLFFGGDIQTTPFLFTPETLLGMQDQVESAKITYKLPFQVNFSLRFNLL